jgi:hypothetical protein
MKIIILVSILFVGRVYAAPTAAPIDGYALFFDLKEDAAKAKAEVLARDDFKNGRYRILVAGLRPSPGNDPYEKNLAKYGIECCPIAGCIVSSGILGAIAGYNGVMKPLLIQKFGPDVFRISEDVK